MLSPCSHAEELPPAQFAVMEADWRLHVGAVTVTVVLPDVHPDAEHVIVAVNAVDTDDGALYVVVQLPPVPVVQGLPLMLPEPEVTEHEMLRPEVIGFVLAVIVDVCPAEILAGSADAEIVFVPTVTVVLPDV